MSKIIGNRLITHNQNKWYLQGGVALSDCVAAYQPKGAESLVKSYVNVAHPGIYDIGIGIAPGWSAIDGWRFNGVNQYLATLITPPTSQTWGALIRYSNWNQAQYSLLMGTFHAEIGQREFCIGRQSAYCVSQQGTLAYTLPTSGVVGFSGGKVFVNGIHVGTMTTPAAFACCDILIGAAKYYTPNTPLYFALCRIQALEIFSITPTDAQMIAISAAMAAL